MPIEKAPNTPNGQVFAQCPNCRQMLGIIPVGQLRNEHGKDAEGLIQAALDKLVADHECAAKKTYTTSRKT